MSQSQSQSRFVLDSNNLWVVGNSDGTVAVVDGPDVADPVPTDAAMDVSTWPEMARIGTSSASTHKELEVFGAVLSGQKLEELSKNAYGLQFTVNREGFMVMWIKTGGGGDKGPKKGDTYRRLNDLFDWSKHGVEVPTPLDAEWDWDRYQLTTGKLMAELSALVNLPKVIEELEEEIQTLRDDKDWEIRELQKQVEEKGGQSSGGGGKDKDKELAEKDHAIATLRAALKLFL